MNEEFKGERLMVPAHHGQASHVTIKGKTADSPGQRKEDTVGQFNTEMGSVNSDRAALQTRNLSHPIY